ncbi:MAG TPA: cation diffusion facilitator family transporter [Capillimicrobium sp.]|nr:cation diffusion facilitator family transporter [Capillimicrobium sp.]
MAPQMTPGPAASSAGRPPQPVVKRRAAALSVTSNALLIVLKFAAGLVTGSVALLAEAMQSVIDLVASVVAYVSVRKADEPADENHPYGHHKIENVAAAVEGVLILVGSGVIAVEAVRRLIDGGEVEQIGFGIAIIALTIVVNLVVSAVLARRARETESPALEGDAAHLRTDALTSVGVLVGLVLVQVTGASWLDPVVALLVAAAIVWTGVRLLMRSGRVLVDEALPEDELAQIRDTVVSFAPSGVVGFHKLRARRAGARRLVDMHVQFYAGATLEEAHATAHRLQDAIRERLGDADVLIHIEPADRVRPGTELRPPQRSDAPDPPAAGA